MAISPRILTSDELPLPSAAKRRNILLALDFYTHDRHMGIVRYAREAGWTLDCRLLAFRASEARHMQYLRATRYDGIIAYLSGTSHRMSRLIESFKVPMVDLGMDRPDITCPRVLPDSVAIGRMGAEYLLGRGFTNLLFYTHYYDTWATTHRMKGFQEAVTRAGAEFQSLIWSENSRRRGKTSRVKWLSDKLLEYPLPLAVMAINDHVALEVLHACELAQLRVPEQVVVLGVDNDSLVVDLTAIPISSVDSNRERIGYEAAALLDRLIDGVQPESDPILIPPKGVVTRKSTDILAVNDTDVAIAIHYIWEHFRETITVDDVARQTMLSRRHLQDRFLQHVGRTIFEEITIQRLNYAKRLLEQTDKKAYTIARMAGFGSAERMSKVFRRLVGMGPRTYRERHHKAVN